MYSSISSVIAPFIEPFYISAMVPIVGGWSKWVIRENQPNKYQISSIMLFFCLGMLVIFLLYRLSSHFHYAMLYDNQNHSFSRLSFKNYF